MLSEKLSVHFLPSSAASAAAGCSSALIPEMTAAILPSGLITNVVRSIPRYFLPYMLFSLSTPKRLAIDFSSSASRGKGKPNFSLNFFWAEGLSGEMPRTTAPAFWNFWYASRNPDACAVQPEVLALA